MNKYITPSLSTKSSLKSDRTGWKTFFERRSLSKTCPFRKKSCPGDSKWTFLSPNVGGHLTSDFGSLNHPKKVTFAELPGYFFSNPESNFSPSSKIKISPGKLIQLKTRSFFFPTKTKGNPVEFHGGRHVDPVVPYNTGWVEPNFQTFK